MVEKNIKISIISIQSNAIKLISTYNTIGRAKRIKETNVKSTEHIPQVIKVNQTDFRFQSSSSLDIIIYLQKALQI